jgi:hypothetical protein
MAMVPIYRAIFVSGYRLSMDRVARRNHRRETGTLFDDSYEGIGAAQPRNPDAPSLAVTLVLFIIQIILSSLFVFLAAVSGLITDSCGGRDCNFSLIEFSGWVAVLGIPAVFVACVGLSVRNHNRSRTTWWIPLSGIGASLLVLLISIGLLQWGVGPIVG